MADEEKRTNGLGQEVEYDEDKGRWVPVKGENASEGGTEQVASGAESWEVEAEEDSRDDERDPFA